MEPFLVPNHWSTATGNGSAQHIAELFTRCDRSVNRLSLQSTGQLPVAALRGRAQAISVTAATMRNSAQLYSSWNFWLRYRCELDTPTPHRCLRAWELIYTGRVIDAAEAERLGIVSRSVPPENLMDTALGVAGEIAANSPFGMWMTKEVLWSNLETPSMRRALISKIEPKFLLPRLRTRKPQ